MSNSISFWTKVRYGAADMGLALQQSAIQFFMLFYFSDVAKINPGIAGTALLVSKLSWDIVNDPLFGHLSDKTRSRWGRRRPYMMFAAIPLGLSFWLLFSLPEGLTGFVAFIAAFGAYLLFDTFHTMIQMAYYSMTAEMSTDYNERTSISSVRSFFSTIGYILGAALTTMIVGMLRDGAGFTERASWSTTALIFGIFAMIVVLFTALTVRNKPATNSAPVTMPIFKGIKHCLSNRPFRLFMLISAIVSVSFALMTTLLPYYLIYQLGMESELSFVMLVLLVTVVLFIFPVKKIADRIGKAKTYGIGLGLSSLVFIAAFFLPNEPTPLIYAVAFLAGVGLTGQYVFPASMVPDVVEYDEKMTGQRREGIFFGIWAMIGKVTGAFAIALAGWSLTWFGYQEGAAQSAETLLGIRLFFAIVPAVLFIISIPMLIKYPITKDSHCRLVEEIRSQSSGSVDV